MSAWGHSEKPTPYAVHCPHHGLCYLTHEEYGRQMSLPDSKWACPVCNETASWDDAIYEEAMDAREREEIRKLSDRVREILTKSQPWLDRIAGYSVEQLKQVGALRLEAMDAYDLDAVYCWAKGDPRVPEVVEEHFAPLDGKKP